MFGCGKFTIFSLLQIFPKHQPPEARETFWNIYFFASQVRRLKWHEKTCFPATRWNDLEMDGSDHRIAEKHVTRLWTYKRNWKHNTTAIPSDKAGDKAKKHKHFARSHREINWKICKKILKKSCVILKWCCVQIYSLQEMCTWIKKIYIKKKIKIIGCS